MLTLAATGPAVKDGPGPTDGDNVSQPPTPPNPPTPSTATAEIELSWQPAKDDFREVVLTTQRTRRRVVFAVLALVGILELVLGWGMRDASLVWLGGIILTLLAFLVLNLRLRAGAGFWKHDFLRSPKRAVLSRERGLEIESSESTGTYAWAAFESCQETENLFVLRMKRAGRRPGAFLALPKRAVAHGDELARTRAFLQSVVPGGVRPV